jgi:predicted aldo/keto reductase-like oxidoreductase
MKYRKFSNRIDFKPSALGFGLMRPPMTADNKVDDDEAVKIIRYAIDNGVNYLDTAYVYFGGDNERLMAKVLKDGYRDKVKITSKMPMWNIKEEKDLDVFFNESLDRMEVEKIDFYLFHSLGAHSLEMFEKYNLFQWAEKKKSEGKIDYIGFSFHDKAPVLKQIIDLYDRWDFCMVQFNLVDIKEQMPLEYLQYAKSKDVGVIIMEPLRGGQLTTSIPPKIQELWEKMAKLYNSIETNPAKYLLDFIWNHSEVSHLISGMSNMQQVEQNLSYAEDAEINKLTDDKLELFKQIQKAYLDTILINCTDCKYCSVCPNKIAIPTIFNNLNEIVRYDDEKIPLNRNNFIAEDKRASKCTGCGECLAHCPQKLDIPELLSKCAKVFDDKLGFDKIFPSI